MTEQEIEKLLAFKGCMIDWVFVDALNFKEEYHRATITDIRIKDGEISCILFENPLEFRISTKSWVSARLNYNDFDLEGFRVENCRVVVHFHKNEIVQLGVLFGIDIVLLPKNLEPRIHCFYHENSNYLEEMVLGILREKPDSVK